MAKCPNRDGCRGKRNRWVPASSRIKLVALPSSWRTPASLFVAFDPAPLTLVRAAPEAGNKHQDIPEQAATRRPSPAWGRRLSELGCACLSRLHPTFFEKSTLGTANIRAILCRRADASIRMHYTFSEVHARAMSALWGINSCPCRNGERPLQVSIAVLWPRASTAWRFFRGRLLRLLYRLS